MEPNFICKAGYGDVGSSAKPFVSGTLQELDEFCQGRPKIDFTVTDGVDPEEPDPEEPDPEEPEPEEPEPEEPEPEEPEPGFGVVTASGQSKSS